MVGSSINLSDLQSGSFTGYVGSQGVIGYTGSKGEFGGAAFEYNYSNTTSNADPGPGFLRFNSLDLSTATTLYLDFLDVASANSFNYLQTIDDSTSGIKGTFKIEDKANTQVFAFFSITGSHSHPTDYFQVPIAWINGVTSFTNNLDTVTTFVRTGDKGDIGYTGSQGAIGYTGSQGYTGSKGDIGYTGSQGYTGSASTVIGYTGSQGVIGYTGSKGDTGAPGPKSVTILSPAANDEVSILWSNTALTLAEIRSVVRGDGHGTPTVNATFSWGTSRESGTIIQANMAISNTTNGNTLTSFTNSTPTASSFIWVKINETTGTVLEFHASLRFT